jgi:hypothetical protein
MAGKHGIALAEDITLVAATPMTVMQIVAAANHPVEITEITVGFDGTDNTHEPVEVDVVRQTTAGTMSAVTVAGANDSDGDTFDTSAQHTATGEPTSPTMIRKWRVHPQWCQTYQVPDNAPLHIGAGDRVGIRCTAAAGVDIDVTVCFEE